MALYLARQGFNIVLIAKTLPELNRVAKEIQDTTQKSNRPVKTRVIVQDFTKEFQAEVFEKLYDQKLADIDISILINNVGIGEPGSFLEANEEDLHDQVTANTYPIVLLTQQCIKSFRARYEDRRMRSLLINVSDMCALAPCPYNATFAGTKLFAEFIAQGLQHELHKYAVDICAWRVGEIQQNPNVPPKSMLEATPEQYVSAAFTKCTSGVHYGYLPHEVMGLIIENLKDIVPIEIPMKFFANQFRQKARNAKKSK